MLVRAVVIAGYRARADVHAFTNFGVADVSQVIHLAALGYRALLHLDEITDLDVVGEFRTRTQPRERADFTIVARRRTFDVAV